MIMIVEMCDHMHVLVCSCLVLDTPLPGCDCTDGAPDQQYTCADQVLCTSLTFARPLACLNPSNCTPACGCCHDAVLWRVDRV